MSYPLARATDPETSHKAAASVNLTRGQEIVLEVFERVDNITDFELCAILRRWAQDDKRFMISESGARSRRAELTAAGILEDSGMRSTLESGRSAIIWQRKK